MTSLLARAFLILALVASGCHKAPSPTILGFEVGVTPIVAGESTTLTPWFSGGTGAVDNGVGAVTSGTPTTVTPGQTTTYTLTVTGPGGTTTATVAVEVTAGASLTVTLDGDLAPAPSVAVTGPDGPVATLSASQTLTGLSPGAYSASAQAQTTGGIGYEPVVGPAVVLADGDAGAIEVTYTARNTPPTIAPVPLQLVPLNRSLDIPVTVSDVEDPASALTLDASIGSSDLLASASIIGTGATRTVTVTAGTLSGHATVELAATDTAGNVTTETVDVDVEAVVTSAADSGSGTLRDVVGANQSGGLVVFDPALVGPIQLSSPIAITRSVTIEGPGARLLTVDTGGASSVFTVGVGAYLGVSGLTFQDADQAIFVSGAGNLEVKDCAFIDNAATSGAAINDRGQAQVRRSLFEGNVSDCGSDCSSGGGAMFLTSLPGYPDSSLDVLDSTFTANVAKSPNGAWGSAISIVSGTTTLEGCTVIGNLCQGANCSGGAITALGFVCPSQPCRAPAVLVLTRSIVAANTGGSPADVSIADNQETAGEDFSDNVLGDVSPLPALGFDGASTTGVTDPMLSSLDDHGGPTDTMVPLPDSPALNLVPPLILNGDLVDQRRYVRRADATTRSDSGATDRLSSDPTQ